LAERVRRIWKNYQQPALVEEYLPGKEITVGVMGNRNPGVIGMMAVDLKAEKGKAVYSLEHKRDWKEKVRYLGPETIDLPTREVVESEALKVFRILELRDVARVDFRLDNDGVPKAIDVNPLPGISEAYSDLPILYRLSGGDYPSLLKGILKEAFERQGLKWPRASTKGRLRNVA
jgi:D-alanine-D-alanine ligase